MEKPDIKFGTDGWRAIIADTFTIANVKLCAQATANYLLTKEKKPSVVIGYDTRFGSPAFAKAAADVMVANGVHTYLSHDPVPTPVTSYGVITRKATGAIVITASHNPASYNGFKIKSSDGASLPIDDVAIIEANIKQLDYSDIKSVNATETLNGLFEYVDLYEDYYKHVAELVDLNNIRNSKLKIAVDSMHGAGIGYLKKIINGAKVSELHNDINPNFPDMNQPEPIDANLHKMESFIKSEHYDIGLATDGDADRLGVIDENGVYLTQLQVYALLAYYMLEVRKEKGMIVKTITTTNMLYKLGKLYDVPVEEVNVGFKYVAPVMIKNNALIGGEESGGYGFRGHIPERDGILAGLFFIDLMIRTGKKPSELINKLYDLVGPHYYDRDDVKFDESQRYEIIQKLAANQPKEILGVKVDHVRTDDGFKYYLEDGSWLLIRFSGTEPLLRIYTETDSKERVDALLKEGAKLAGVA